MKFIQFNNSVTNYILGPYEIIFIWHQIKLVFFFSI